MKMRLQLNLIFLRSHELRYCGTVIISLPGMAIQFGCALHSGLELYSKSIKAVEKKSGIDSDVG